MPDIIYFLPVKKQSFRLLPLSNPNLGLYGEQGAAVNSTSIVISVQINDPPYDPIISRRLYVAESNDCTLIYRKSFYNKIN